MSRTRISKADEIQPRGVLNQKPDYKPRGMWYEVDGDWQRWCASEQPNWLEGKNLFSVTLGSERMLCIRSPEALVAFNERFAIPFAGMEDLDFLKVIDWPAVVDEYDGIEIAPYQWSQRFGPSWYYGWDCASGCIWLPRGVRVERIGVVTLPTSIEDEREIDR